MEEWKVIKDYPRYEISSFGRIKSNISNKLLKPLKVGKYLAIGLKNSLGYKKFYIHRLVAIAFIKNINNYPQINHIDENPLNNNVSNLEWCTSKYNANYGTRNIKIANTFSKKVICLETREIYNSAREAGRQLNISHCEIVSCCNLKRRKSARGKHFCYLSDLKTIKDIENISKTKYKNKKIMCVETKQVFNSITEASKFVGTSVHNISCVLRKKTKTAKKYHWIYC